MGLKFFYSIALLAVFMLASCNAVDTTVTSNSQRPASNASSPQANYADGARRITIDEFETLLKDGKAFVVDVRNQAAYDLGHIPGARLIPAGEIANHINELPRDKMIVTYCS